MAGVGSEPWSQFLWSPRSSRPRPLPTSHTFLFSVLQDAPEVTKAGPGKEGDEENQEHCGAALGFAEN